jgi:hypothetical protein
MLRGVEQIERSKPMTPTLRINGLVTSDPKQPGCQAVGRPTERVEAFQRALEGLRRQIDGLVIRSAHTAHVSEHGITERDVDLGEVGCLQP